jgi:hypothetical protein
LGIKEKDYFEKKKLRKIWGIEEYPEKWHSKFFSRLTWFIVMWMKPAAIHFKLKRL